MASAALSITTVAPRISQHLDVLVLVVERRRVEPDATVGEQRLEPNLEAVEVFGVVVLDVGLVDRSSVDATAAEAAAVLAVRIEIVGPLEPQVELSREVVPVGVAAVAAGDVEVGALVAGRIERFAGVKTGCPVSGSVGISSGVWLATRVAACLNSFSSFV